MLRNSSDAHPSRAVIVSVSMRRMNVFVSLAITDIISLSFFKYKDIILISHFQTFFELFFDFTPFHPGRGTERCRGAAERSGGRARRRWRVRELQNSRIFVTFVGLKEKRWNS